MSSAATHRASSLTRRLARRRGTRPGPLHGGFPPDGSNIDNSSGWADFNINPPAWYTAILGPFLEAMSALWLIYTLWLVLAVNRIYISSEHFSAKRQVPFLGRTQRLVVPRSELISFVPFEDPGETEVTDRDLKVKRLSREVFHLLCRATPGFHPRLEIRVNRRFPTFGASGPDPDVPSEKDRGLVWLVVGHDFKPDDVACILAHELAHIVAEHSRETVLLGARTLSPWSLFRPRVSHRVLSILLFSNPASGKTRLERIGDEIFTLWTLPDAVLHPRRRHFELEADQIGGLLYARAGFFPSFYVRQFSEKLSQRSRGSHPSNSLRSQLLQDNFRATMDAFVPSSRADRIHCELQKLYAFGTSS